MSDPLRRLILNAAIWVTILAVISAKKGWPISSVAWGWLIGFVMALELSSYAADRKRRLEKR